METETRSEYLNEGKLVSEDEQDCWTVRRTSVMELSRNGNLRKAQGYLRMTISKVI